MMSRIWRAISADFCSERPKIVRERRAITRGTLLSARSIGTVTCCSTSSAAWPG
jgi:hypothetical protein